MPVFKGGSAIVAIKKGANTVPKAYLGASLAFDSTTGGDGGGGGGGFSPASLFAGAQGFWLDPSDASTMFTDVGGTTPAVVGDQVARINDKSGNGRHALQGTLASRPTLRAGGYLDFDGGDFLSVGGYAMTGAGAHSAAVALYLASTAGIQQILDADDGGTRISQIVRVNAGVPESIAFNTTPAAFVDACAAMAATTPTVISQVTAAGAVEIFKGGVGNGSTATSGTMASAATGVTIGRGSAGSSPMTGRIYGAIQLARAFTAGERASVEAYLAAKAGL